VDCAKVVYTGPLARLPRLTDEVSFDPRSLSSAPLTCVLTDDAQICELAERRSWVYLPGDPPNGTWSGLRDYHKIENVAYFRGEEGLVDLVSTKVGLPHVPGEIDREEINFAYPLLTNGRREVLKQCEPLQASGFHLLGRMATHQHVTVDHCIRSALDLARGLFQ